MILKKGGQWYRFFDRYNEYVPRDFCQFARRAIFYPLLLTFAGSLLGFIALMWVVGTIHLILWPFGLLFPYGGIGLGAIMVASAIWLCAAAFACVGTGIYVAENVNTPAAISEVYQGFKEKYCPLVFWE